MKHVKIFSRENGRDVKIQCYLCPNGGWSFNIYRKVDKDDTWFSAVTANDPVLVDNDYDARDEARLERKLEFVTKCEVQMAMLELWNKMKPEVLA